MEDTVLITIDDIKQVTSISENIDTQMLEPFLFNAQEIYIRPICGDALMNAMVDDVATGGTTYSELINNYIIYALSYASWFSAAPFMAYKTEKKGIVKQSSDNSDNLDTTEMSIYLQRIENMMTFYLSRLRTYLDDNSSTYPLYCKDDDILPSNSSSIFLGFN